MDQFEQLYRDNYKRIYAFLYRLCRNVQTAEDLTQETFYQAYVSLHRFDGSSEIADDDIELAERCRDLNSIAIINKQDLEQKFDVSKVEHNFKKVLYITAKDFYMSKEFEQDVMEVMKEIHPGGTDVVIDCTGIEECIQMSLKLARKGGTVALAGYGRGKTMSIRMDDIHINNLRVVGAGNNWNQHKKAVTMMAEGSVNIERYATELIKIEEYERGLELARKRPEGFVKAVFCYE